MCTTELAAFSRLELEFAARDVKLIGLSANDVDSHQAWIKDIDEVSGSQLQFPIIADPERKISYLYDMVDYEDTTNVDKAGMDSVLVRKIATNLYHLHRGASHDPVRVYNRPEEEDPRYNGVSCLDWPERH